MNLLSYVDHFFDELTVFEDVERGHQYKAFMRQAVLDFLENETKETALGVYTAFFDSYRITLADEKATFIDLLDALKHYEEKAATLIDKQRDHYIHSVNVFILGLCIFGQNENFRNAFAKAHLDKTEYPFSYDTQNEEFFYRWGIAALFHDIGYPVEIINKQFRLYIEMATEVDEKAKINPYLAFDDFAAFNSIHEIVPKKQFTQTYSEKYDSCVYIDLLKPIDLLAHQIHLSLDVDLKQIKFALDHFLNVMASNGFVDHGFYSAIIVLKWYGYLIQKCGYKPEYFFYPVLDSASAILLHNYYRNGLMKPPFSLGPLDPKKHPIAFLLILCDELQEWNRPPYGAVDRSRNRVGEVSLSITDAHLALTFLVEKGSFPAQFAAEKEELFNSVLNMKALFPDGYSIDCQVLEELSPLAGPLKADDSLAPRPLLENLEKLAVAIHEQYVQRQIEKKPAHPPQYPRFSDLPDSLKYSNLRQARTMVDLLDKMGWKLCPEGSDGAKIEQFSAEEIETLAAFEHDEWMKERLQTGWKLGDSKDIDNKITRHLVAYKVLPDEIKDLDRESVRDFPKLAKMIGMKICKQ
jgi:hypothetical protein